MRHENVVVVTGATGGIGSAIAAVLSERGATVVGLDREAATGSRAAAMTRAVDVTSDADIRAALGETVAAFGRVDGLVNAAGIYVDGAVSSMDEQTFARLFAVNVTGTFLASRVFGAAMREFGSGAIVNISSIAAVLSSPLNGAYGATKGAVDSLTRAFAVDLAPAGVRVNAIAPGPVLTPMAEAALRDPAYAERMLSRIALGRLGTPRDIAGVVAFLLSQDAAWMTGTVVTVDGGVSALR